MLSPLWGSQRERRIPPYRSGKFRHYRLLHHRLRNQVAVAIPPCRSGKSQGGGGLPLRSRSHEEVAIPPYRSGKFQESSTTTSSGLSTSRRNPTVQIREVSPSSAASSSPSQPSRRRNPTLQIREVSPSLRRSSPRCPPSSPRRNPTVQIREVQRPRTTWRWRRSCSCRNPTVQIREVPPTISTATSSPRITSRNPTMQIREVPTTAQAKNPKIAVKGIVSQSHRADQGSTADRAHADPQPVHPEVAIPPYRSGKFPLVAPKSPRRGRQHIARGQSDEGAATPG